MSATKERSLEKLLTLLTHAQRGAFAIALYDRLSVRREMVAALRSRLSQRIHEIHLSEDEKNPVDLIRAIEPNAGDVVMLFDMERAFPDTLRYLDFHRESLAEMGISLVCWVNRFEHRELAQKAPNFYAFRTTVFDFTTVDEPIDMEQVFIGRKRELKKLTDMLESKGVIVLTGLGGVGKTALAQETTRRAVSLFAGGTVWINCETRPSVGEIILTAGVAFVGEVVRQLAPEEQRERLDDALHDRACLIVLDNFEFIINDGDVLRWVITVSPPSTVLIVSRDKVPSTFVLPMELSAMRRDEAVELFINLAKNAGWEGKDEEAVPRLCEMAGDLPLAIAMLAPRAAELSLTGLEKLLAEEKDHLRAELPRSVGASLRLSFDRLSEDARNLLMRLSVVPDGVNERTIGPLTGIEEWHHPAAECVRFSLLNFDGKRYRLHPLVRRFALAQLGDATKAWQRRFIDFFRKLVKENSNINDLSKLVVLDEDWRNVIAAAEAAAALSDHDSVIAIAHDLGEFLLLRGKWLECERLCESAVAAARASDDRKAEGLSLSHLGVVYTYRGRLPDAESVLRQSISISQELGIKQGLGRSLINLGNVYRQQGRWAEAEEMYNKDLEICREFSDRKGEGDVLNNLGLIHKEQGNWARAEDALRQSLKTRREISDRIGEKGTLNNLGLVYLNQGQWAEAEKAFQQSRAISNEFGDHSREGRTLANLALLREKQGDLNDAIRFAQEALRVLDATQDEEAKAALRELLAELGQPSEA